MVQRYDRVPRPRPHTGSRRSSARDSSRSRAPISACTARAGSRRFGDAARQADRYRAGPRLPRGRCRAYPQPGGRAGSQPGRAGRGQPGLETRARHWPGRTRRVCWTPTRPSDIRSRRAYCTTPAPRPRCRGPGAHADALRDMVASFLDTDEVRRRLASMIQPRSISAAWRRAPTCPGSVLGNCPCRRHRYPGACPAPDGPLDSALPQVDTRYHPARRTGRRHRDARRGRNSVGDDRQDDGQAVLVRPDGYVALAGDRPGAAGLTERAGRDRSARPPDRADTGAFRLGYASRRRSARPLTDDDLVHAPEHPLVATGAGGRDGQ